MNHQPRKLLEPSVIYSTQKMKKSLMEIFIFYVVLPFSKMAVEIGFTLLSYWNWKSKFVYKRSFMKIRYFAQKFSGIIRVKLEKD